MINLAFAYIGNEVHTNLYKRSMAGRFLSTPKERKTSYLNSFFFLCLPMLSLTFSIDSFHLYICCSMMNYSLNNKVLWYRTTMITCWSWKTAQPWKTTKRSVRFLSFQVLTKVVNSRPQKHGKPIKLPSWSLTARMGSSRTLWPTSSSSSMTLLVSDCTRW